MRKQALDNRKRKNKEIITIHIKLNHIRNVATFTHSYSFISFIYMMKPIMTARIVVMVDGRIEKTLYYYTYKETSKRKKKQNK